MNTRPHACPIAVAAAALALLAAGCNPFSGPLPGDPEPAPYFIQHLEGEGTYPLEIDLGAASKNVYLTFVNPYLSSVSGSVTVDGNAARQAPASEEAAANLVSSMASPKRAPTPAHITEYNQDPFRGRSRSAPSLRLLERAPAPLFDEEGDSGSLRDDFEIPRAAHCRKVVPGVAVGGVETRTLNIWVADNCWDGPPDPDGDRSFLINQGMVDALAERFLKPGPFDDIYDWVRGMLGSEWGQHGSEYLIAPNDEITIFLCDIGNDDEPNGGVVGFFWAKDDFKIAYEPTSNERIMFTIDAVMYANDEGGGSGWNATDPWPEDIFSTLAHEFQHMIHFYQRGVLRDAMGRGDDDTWINEMASQVVEDLLSDRMGVPGPRGVDGTDGTAGPVGNTSDRLKRFNANNDVSLTDWRNNLESYSITYAFGAWLVRNYGGAKLLNRLMQCSLTGPASIEDIVSQATGSAESFPRLLQRWSAAQLLSNVTDAPYGYRYNTGGFVDSSVNGNTYQLGSINLYNYSQTPYLYTRANVGGYRPLSTSQALCQAALLGTGAIEWTLDMPDGVIATVVIR